MGQQHLCKQVLTTEFPWSCSIPADWLTCWLLDTFICLKLHIYHTSPGKICIERGDLKEKRLLWLQKITYLNPVRKKTYSGTIQYSVQNAPFWMMLLTLCFGAWQRIAGEEGEVTFSYLWNCHFPVLWDIFMGLRSMFFRKSTLVSFLPLFQVLIPCYGAQKSLLGGSQTVFSQMLWCQGVGTLSGK